MTSRRFLGHSFNVAGLFASYAVLLVAILGIIGLNTLSNGRVAQTAVALASNVSSNLTGNPSDPSTRSGQAISALKQLITPQPRKPDRVISPATVQDAVPAKGKFIGADLKAMKLYLYQDGALVDTFDVQSKGRPGSRWDTPSGEYSILYKNSSHFSSIGEVYMPWSMQFFGNFFIHGWPYYPDGTLVGEGYSGGCIRLSTDDAKKVYQFSDIGTSLYVYDTDTKIAERRGGSHLVSIPLPDISAHSYLVADLETGEVFTEKNADEIVPIASISKLMTAVVANETISFSRLIPISQNAYNTYGGQGNIQVGEKFTITHLYFPLLLNSSNDAAVAISEYGAGSKAFISQMNKKADAIGMTSTSFEDPSGLSPNNLSTANDLFKLAQYIQTKKRFIFDITTKQQEDVPATATAPARTYKNNNPMRDREDFLGGKNGFTDEARKTLLSLFKVKDGSYERIIAVVVLGSEDHKTDTLKLNEWMNESFGNIVKTPVIVKPTTGPNGILVDPIKKVIAPSLEQRIK